MWRAEVQLYLLTIYDEDGPRAIYNYYAATKPFQA